MEFVIVITRADAKIILKERMKYQSYIQSTKIEAFEHIISLCHKFSFES